MRFLIALAVVALVVGFGCISAPPLPPPGQNGTDSDGTLTKALCVDAGGLWNECGSACRGAPDGTACIMMCVQYCECGGLAGFRCPSGHTCTDYLPSKDTPDAMGICKKLS
jgi:hypothetical protein